MFNNPDTTGYTKSYQYRVKHDGYFEYPITCPYCRVKYYVSDGLHSCTQSFYSNTVLSHSEDVLNQILEQLKEIKMILKEKN